MDEKTTALFIALFNTMLGLTNIEKNDKQYEHQNEVERKIDLILEKVESIERRLLEDA